MCSCRSCRSPESLLVFFFFPLLPPPLSLFFSFFSTNALIHVPSASKLLFIADDSAILAFHVAVFPKKSRKKRVFQ